MSTFPGPPPPPLRTSYLEAIKPFILSVESQPFFLARVLSDRVLPDHPGDGGHGRADAEQHDGPLDAAPPEAEERLLLLSLLATDAPPRTAAVDDGLCSAAALVELPVIVEHVTLKSVIHE